MSELQNGVLSIKSKNKIIYSETAHVTVCSCANHFHLRVIKFMQKMPNASVVICDNAKTCQVSWLLHYM